jgi:hypothetical protein
MQLICASRGGAGGEGKRECVCAEGAEGEAREEDLRSRLTNAGKLMYCMCERG